MTRLRKVIDTLLEWMLVCILVFMVLNVLWQIMSRYLLGNPSTFTDELARYLLIWLGLLGAAYANGKGLHVSINLMEKKLAPNQKKAQRVGIHFLVISFALLVLVIGGIRLVYISFHLGQMSSVIPLSLGYVYLVLPLSGLIIIFYGISDIQKLLT